MMKFSANIPRVIHVAALLALFGHAAFTQATPQANDEVSGSPRQELSLDGEWEIVFDPQNVGREQEWHTQDVFSAMLDRRAIEVPCCWEEIEQDYEGVAFYGRTFAVPQEWEGKTVRLQFDAVNYIAEVWVNGHVIGRHEGGYGPFEFRVDDLLNFDEENFVSLRVIGPIVAQDIVIDGIGWSDMPHWRGAIVGGIWQSVRLIATGTTYIDDVFIKPRLTDDSVAVSLALDNIEHVGRNVEAAVSIRSADELTRVATERSYTLDLPPGKSETMQTLTIPQARYWSPDDPHLYVATISISEGDEILDVEKVRFGIRELTIRDNKFELNGEPIYIKAAFFEGLYPTKLALPDDMEMARREIQLAKECGFNMIRPWRKPPPPSWLDLCDEMGVMVVGSMPIECMRRWPTVTPHLNDRIENEVRSAVLRDRNRACIVQWEIFNEIHRLELGRLKHPMSMLARELDPTRLILDESGGFAGGSNMYLPYQFVPELFNDVHNYPGAPLNDDSYNRFLALSKTPEELEAMGLNPAKVRSRTVPGLLTFVSEIGYGSLPDLVDNNERFAAIGNPIVPPYRYHADMARWIREALEESGLDAIYPDLQEFCLDQQELHSQANKRMIESIRSNTSTGGYAVHALTGGDWVLGAGLLDLFRNPKGSYWGTKEASQARYLALRVRPRNIYASRGANITLTGINDMDQVEGTLSLELVSSTGETVWTSQQDAKLPSGVSAMLDEALDARDLSGAYKLRVSLTDDDGTVLTQNVVTLDVYNDIDLSVPDTAIAVLDVNNSLRPFLRASGVSFAEFDAETPMTTPVFVSKPVAKNPEEQVRFALLNDFVERGGTAVYLETVQRWNNSFWGGEPPMQEALPLDLEVQHAMGLWVGVSHIVTEHPVFEGLPTRCMMGQAYENVWTPQTLLGFEATSQDNPGVNDPVNLGPGTRLQKVTDGDLIVGSISHGWYNGDDNRQNYLGPSPAWYGMDLGVVPQGEGRYVLSALRIVDNLGKDPVADKILFNLIKWTVIESLVQYRRFSVPPVGHTEGRIF
jgi:beta-galactosidase